MRILTVRQPWAWAIIHGGKTVENRSRSLAPYRGPVLIHAGRSIDFDAADSLPLRLAWHEAFLPERKLEGGFVEPIFRELPDEDPQWMPTGAIIGVVDLVDVHSDGSRLCAGSNGDEVWESCSRWAESGAHHLVLANPCALDQPIPYKGALGLRKTEFEIEGDWLAAPWGHPDRSCTPYGCEPGCHLEPVARLIPTGEN